MNSLSCWISVGVFEAHIKCSSLGRLLQQIAYSRRNFAENHIPSLETSSSTRDITLATFSAITKHKQDITYLVSEFSEMPSLVNSPTFQFFHEKAASNKRNFSATFSRSHQMSLCNSLSWTMLAATSAHSAKWEEKTSQCCCCFFNSRHMANGILKNNDAIFIARPRLKEWEASLCWEESA